MTDIMLVLAVGFLIFAMMSTGMQQMQQQQQQQQTVEVEEGQEVSDVMESIDSSSSGYTQTGIVYTDPKTNKQYMVAT